MSRTIDDVALNEDIHEFFIDWIAYAFKEIFF